MKRPDACAPGLLDISLRGFYRDRSLAPGQRGADRQDYLVVVVAVNIGADVLRSDVELVVRVANPSRVVEVLVTIGSLDAVAKAVAQVTDQREIRRQRIRDVAFDINA